MSENSETTRTHYRHGRDEAESEGGVIADSPQAIRARAEGASVIQVELGLGKNAAILLWLSSLVSAAALVGLFAVWNAYDNALANTTAHVNTLQYDLAAVKAQLVEQGLYEPTSH